MHLNKSLITQIKRAGKMPFVDFMHKALYEPNLGYYSAGMQVFGKEGDFITAPELSPLFGQTLANQCQQVLTDLDDASIFEFGAGSGQLCIDILRQLEHHDALPENYFILDVSGTLQARQQTHIQQSIPHLVDRVHWLSQWPKKAFNGVVIANEVLDAMPVHRFLQTENELLESYITLTKEDTFLEAFLPCTNARLIEHIKLALPDTLAPYQSEANLYLPDWLQQCSAMLNKGAMFIIDYGFPRHEYYHPDRDKGTLMCHHKHRAHPNPLIHIGEQDITAHVDFTHVAEAGYDAGFHVAGYTNQAAFLLSNGLLSLLSSSLATKEQIEHQHVIKQLTHPSEMGELFKVIALTKDVDYALTGFQLQDKRGSL